MTLEQLQQIRLLADVPAEQLSPLLPRLHSEHFAAGATLLCCGAPSRQVYFLLAGTVRVVLCDAAGGRHVLAELGAGDTLGERALLTGEARSADVVALTPVQAAILDAADFEALLAASPQLARNLCRQLARQIGNWAERHQRDERENRTVLANLVGWQLLPEFDAFPGASPWARQLNARIRQLAAGNRHVLVCGERGTWKDLVARLLHYHHPDRERPVLFLDCAEPPLLRSPSGAATVEQPALLCELAQEAALFGAATTPSLAGRGPRRGLLELADGGDLILRNVEALAPRLQRLLAEALQGGSSRVRLIASGGGTDLEGTRGVALEAPLAALFDTEQLVLLPLRERKKDIPVIARQLLATLNRKQHKAVRRLSPEALNLLLDHDWPLNGSELYQVLSRAVAVCDGPEIGAEQIFLPGQALSGGRFNLLGLPAVERLLRRPGFPGVLRRVSVPLFLLVTAGALFGPLHDNPAHLAVWALFWPALLLTAALGARSWCSFCPLEAVGGLCARRGGAGDPPEWLRRWGPALSMAGLVALLLFEQAGGLFGDARGTGLLLLGLLLATALADLLLGRRAWCKHLCPLGRAVSLVARLSLVEMRSNPNVCAGRCRIDDCLKEKSCPMGLHPAGVNSSDHCILCLSCLRNCPHRSMHLDLRVPAVGILDRPRRRFSEALFAVSLAGAVLAAKGAPLFSGATPADLARTGWGVAELGGAALLLGGYLALALLAALGSRSGRRLANFTICGQAYLPLGFAALFLLYFRVLVERGAQLPSQLLVQLGLDGRLDPALITPELGTLRLLIAPLVVAGTLCSLHLLQRLGRQYALDRPSLLGHRLLLAASGLAFLAIL